MNRKERAQLKRIEAGALDELRKDAADTDFNRAWLESRVALYTGEHEAALRGFTNAKDRRYLDAGSAMALAAMGRDEEAEEAFRKRGLWVEGGSVEGHRLAGHAFLPRYAIQYDELWTEPPTDPEAIARYRNAARTASKPQRLRMIAALEHALGRTALAYKQVKAGLADSLGAEIALAVGDLHTARAIFESYRKSSGSSWWQPSGDATKATGFLGSAAVAHAEQEYTRVIGWAKKALELAKDRRSTVHRQALLVLWAAEVELGLESKTHARLRRAAPLQHVAFGHLALDELEAELDVVDTKRVAADEGDALWDEDRAAAAQRYEKALGLGRKVRAKIALGERRDLIAARLLYSLCERDEIERAESIARACIAGSPDFLNAWDTVAWCTESRDAFDDAGLAGEWDTSEPHSQRVSLRAWKKRPVELALRQRPASRSKHAGNLGAYGAFDVALRMYESMDLAKDSPDRFLAAWACWTPVAPVDCEGPVGRRYTPEQKREAARAWSLLEPLIVARWNVFYQRQPFDPWVLAVHLLHAMGSWARLIEVAHECSEEQWSGSWYRPANAGIAPWYADALAHHEGTDAALKLLEQYLNEEPHDRRLLESFDAIAQRDDARAKPRLTKKATWDPESRARELSFRAWRLETEGELDEAFAVYRESAELDLEPMALSNVANLVSRSGDHARAEAYWHAAFIRCAEVHPRFRVSGFLAKLAWHSWLRERPADAIPLGVHAFELLPTAGIAHTIAIAYRALGDDARADEWIRKGLAVDSRNADLRALR